MNLLPIDERSLAAWLLLDAFLVHFSPFPFRETAVGLLAFIAVVLLFLCPVLARADAKVLAFLDRLFFLLPFEIVFRLDGIMTR